jgi:hypothetical protein
MSQTKCRRTPTPAVFDYVGLLAKESPGHGRQSYPLISRPRSLLRNDPIPSNAFEGTAIPRRFQNGFPWTAGLLEVKMAKGGIADCSKAGNCVVVCPKDHAQRFGAHEDQEVWQISASLIDETRVWRSLQPGPFRDIWVGNYRRAAPSLPHDHELRQLVLLCAGFPQNVFHGNPACHFGVGDHPAVAAPPDSLGAHHAHPLLLSLHVEFCEAVLKQGGLHVVGIRSKSFIVPPSVV